MKKEEKKDRSQKMWGQALCLPIKRCITYALNDMYKTVGQASRLPIQKNSGRINPPPTYERWTDFIIENADSPEAKVYWIIMIEEIISNIWKTGIQEMLRLFSKIFKEGYSAFKKLIKRIAREDVKEIILVKKKVDKNTHI